MEDADVLRLFKRPAGPAELWREQSFEIMLEGRWVSGVFDRVVIVRSPAGDITGVDIIDFKTNRIEHPEQIVQMVEHYRPQMNQYGEVIARLLAVSPSRIRKRLVFTDARRVVDIEHDKKAP
jgi:ATP-dependent exoDNAse (exonuclease V) beta subunit